MKSPRNNMRLTWLFLLIGCSTLVAADWRATRQLPASEAHQAAAAEGKFVYAITSRAVAKYDRATGKRVAVSTGAAKHLNSGFFWKGKLLCAHSNYPLKPERSEIKVLDTDSMKLTTFKDFGNADGSLTWALHKDGFWWCNFALYGADNHKNGAGSVGCRACNFQGAQRELWGSESRFSMPMFKNRSENPYILGGLKVNGKNHASGAGGLRTYGFYQRLLTSNNEGFSMAGAGV